MTARTTLTDILAHHDWANRRLLEEARALGEEPSRVSRPGIGSLATHLAHLATTEGRVLDRCRGQAPAEAGAAAADDLATIATRLEARIAERQAFLDGGGADLERRRVERPGGSPVAIGDLLLHLANHGLHHRAQALAALRLGGRTPPTLDYLIFKIAEPSLEPSPEAAARLRDEGFAVGSAAAAPFRLEADTVREYLRYADWARERLDTTVAGLGAAELDRTFGFGPGTMRQTLRHIHEAEAWWLGNWEGKTLAFDSLPVDIEPAELIERFADTRARRDAFLAALGDDDLERPVEASPGENLVLRFRLGESALQLAGHGTHHRGQAVRMLRVLGVEPPNLAYLAWLDTLPAVT
jgi:uncharacterized damage-inducible protein DinB